MGDALIRFGVQIQDGHGVGEPTFGGLNLQVRFR
uniref:Uncharacterized protein n=1 Tax=Anguilla anguilla TaxID=7936 RepID=A0A0E9UBK4_ANGAN